MISVIIPVYNEERCIGRLLENVSAQDSPGGKEIIVCDGGSTDNTAAVAAEFGRVLHCDKGKAVQMNAGAAIARGDVLFFLHADMTLPSNILKEIRNKINMGYDGGGFANVFDNYNERIKRLGRWMNLRLISGREQSDRGVFYGDNGIFVKKTVFDELGGFCNMPIMEDYDFSIRLKARNRVVKINDPQIVVSARRHEKAGFVKTRFQWVMIKKLYLLGVSPHRLANWYGDVR
ncbi:MAG: TIGR04283 family arsenosugar biosynthesis glycosyltransferase [Flavobacteriales bacterium]